MPLERFANNASTTLAAAVSTAPVAGTSETWTVASTGAPFPQVPQFRLLVDNEIVLVTAVVSGTQWTVTRGAEGTTATHANAASVKHVLTADALRASWAGVPADYVMWREGTSYFARNGWTGALQFTGTEPGAVLQGVITALGTAGGSVVLGGREDFAWGSVPAIPKGILGKLTIQVLSGRVVTLSTAGPRFVDFATSVAGDTFQNIELIGVTVDALAIQADTFGHHLLIGNFRGSSGASTQINMRNIAVRRCSVLNGRIGSGPGQTAVYLATFHSAAGQALNTIENVLIEDLVVKGCNQAVAVTGGKGGTWTGEPDIWVDNVVVRRVDHNLGSASTGFIGSAHVHVGSRAQVGRVIVDDVYGYGSRDVGVEVNCFQDARVSNIVLEEYNGFGVYITNHRAPKRLRDQQAIIRNVSGRHLAANSAVLSFACSVVAVVPLNSQPVGSVIVDGGKYYRDVPSITSSDLAGMAVRVDGEVRAASIANFGVELEGINHTDTVKAAVPSPFYIVPTVSTCQVKLKNLYSSALGTAAVGATAISYNHVYLGGLMALDWDDVAVRMDITSASNFGHRGANVGPTAGSNITGRIRGLRVLSAAATQPRGIVVSSTGTLTIPSELSIEDCDFAAMPSPSLDVVVGAGQEPKVRLDRNKWRVFPLPPVGVTVTASPFLYRSLKGYRERVIVRGGPISLIEFSRDAVTFYDVGETTGQFVLDNGDYLRVTYSAAPTMTAIPEK